MAKAPKKIKAVKQFMCACGYTIKKGATVLKWHGFRVGMCCKHKVQKLAELK